MACGISVISSDNLIYYNLLPNRQSIVTIGRISPIKRGFRLPPPPLKPRAGKTTARAESNKAIGGEGGGEEGKAEEGRREERGRGLCTPCQQVDITGIARG